MAVIGRVDPFFLTMVDEGQEVWGGQNKEIVPVSDII